MTGEKKQREDAESDLSRDQPLEKEEAGGVVARRHFTYALPVYFRLQFTFDEDQVQDTDGEEPQITEAAIQALQDELKEYLQQQYPVDEIEVLDDGLDSVFLGISED